MIEIKQSNYFNLAYAVILCALSLLFDTGISNAAPLPPTSLSVSDVPGDQGGALKLTWVPSTSKEVLRQRIYRSTTAGGPYSLIIEISNNTTNNFTDTGLTNGTTYYYIVRSSSGVQATFTDDSLIAFQTVVMAQHFIELRQAIDFLRSTVGLAPASWTDSTLDGQIFIRAVHVQEMRSRLAEALAVLGLSAPTFTDPDLTASPVVIKKAHIDDLRQWLRVQESGNSNEANAVPAENAGSITGKVTRSDGTTAVAGATIKLTQGGVDEGTATAAADGSYSFTNLSSGNYNVACSATGFLTQNLSASPAGQPVTVNCPLQDANGIAFYNYDETGTEFGKGIGHLTSVIDATGNKVTFEYDQRGQVITQKRTIDGDPPYVFRNTYDSLGRAETITYPDNTVARYAYTNNGLLDKVDDPSAPGGILPYAQYTGYNALGQPSKVTYGNGVTTDYVYKPDNFRIHSIYTSYSAASQCFQSMTYNYDYAGNVKEINDYRDPSGTCGSSAGSNSQQFDYDSLNRLVTAHGLYGTNGTLNYSYDEIGNMICNTEVGACTQQPGYSVPTNYAYPASGAGSVRPHAVTTAGSNTYQYDLNGNMKTGAGRTIDYSQDNRPAKVTIGASTVDFVYDATGTRVEKIFTDNSSTPPITTTNIYVSSLYECKKTTGVVGTSCTKYIFAGDQRIALKDTVSTLYFHSDHLGSASIVTDSVKNADGTVPIVQTLYYLPFGKVRPDSSNPNGGVHYQYTDQENDFETGLYNYGARLYDPAIARFISPDWIVQSMRNPQFLNRYSYTVNNPLRYIDPSGNLTVDDMGPDLTCNFCDRPLNPPPDPEPPRGLNLGDGTNLNCSLCPNTPPASTALDDRFGTGGIGVHTGGAGPGFPTFSSGDGGRRGGNSGGGGTVSNWLTGGSAVGGITTTFTSVFTPNISIPSLTGVGTQALNLVTTAAEVIVSIPQSVSIPAVVLYIWRPIPAGEGSDVIPNTYFSEGQGKRGFSKEDREKGWEASKDANGVPRCGYCGVELERGSGSPKSYEPDHIDPWSRGGPSTLDNLKPSCRSCNREKGAKRPEEWKGP